MVPYHYFVPLISATQTKIRRSTSTPTQNIEERTSQSLQLVIVDGQLFRANSKNTCFGRTAKFTQESEDIAGNRKPREILIRKLQIISRFYRIFLGLASNFVLVSRDVSFCLSVVNCKL